MNRGELREEEAISILEITTPHGAIADKMQTQKTKFYNLDAIIADELDGQNPDFKERKGSLYQMIKLVLKTAGRAAKLNQGAGSIFRHLNIQ